MTKTIHHTIVKSAAKHDARFAEEPDGGLFFIRISDETQRSLESFDSVGEAMEALKADEVTFEAPEDEPFTSKCGVMDAGWHAKYSANPDGPGCNDTIDCTMRSTFMHVTEGSKTPVLDTDALRAFGEALGLWNSRWDTLNPGMQRMNLANRVRGFLRHHDQDITIGATTGRFGIELKAPKAKAVKAPKAPKATHTTMAIAA